MALCLLSTALGSYLAGALTEVVQAISKAITGEAAWVLACATVVGKAVIHVKRFLS